jgi:predicted nucleotidyltransferase
MTQDEYVLGIISKYKRKTINSNVSLFVSSTLQPLIKRWAGENLIYNIEYSGSTAKGTATILGSDVDIFVPLKNNKITLAEYYNGLLEALGSYKPRKQNVSIRIEVDGYKIDIVPGRVIEGYQNYFTLYKSKTGTWVQTNISKNIKIVKDSGRINEIIALKIWRYQHSVDISSTLLELIVIAALKNHKTDTPAENILTVLKYIADGLLYCRIIDPSNTNNILTEDLFVSEKQEISKKAKASSEAKNWADIIW